MLQIIVTPGRAFSRVVRVPRVGPLAPARERGQGEGTSRLAFEARRLLSLYSVIRSPSSTFFDEDDGLESETQEPGLSPIPAILHHSPHFLFAGYLIDFGSDRDIFQGDTERFE